MTPDQMRLMYAANYFRLNGNWYIAELFERWLKESM